MHVTAYHPSPSRARTSRAPHRLHRLPGRLHLRPKLLRIRLRPTKNLLPRAASAVPRRGRFAADTHAGPRNVTHNVWKETIRRPRPCTFDLVPLVPVRMGVCPRRRRLDGEGRAFGVNRRRRPRRARRRRRRIGRGDDDARRVFSLRAARRVLLRR